MPNQRRTFMTCAAGVAGAVVFARSGLAQSGVPLRESDPQAIALGYKTDASKVDKAKYPKYAAGQDCGNCQLFQGKPAEALGPCPLFQGKLVAAKGWCSAWVKKA